jgi:phosphoglycerate dehydrogenase-like enzyme
MNQKPTIAVIMPGWTYKRMFHQRDLDYLAEHASILPLVEPADMAAVKRSLAHAQYALTGWGSPRFEGELLQAAGALKMIAYSAGSVKGLVSDAVYDRGILVSTAAAANAVPVAQFTVAMMVSLLKQIPWLTDAYTRGDMDEVQRRRAVVRELEEMNVGIIGASRVGREVIRLLKSYPKLKIFCHDPYLGEAAARELGVIKATLDEACACEVVSIHAPALPETRHMFSAGRLSLLPDHAVLINTSRGSLVDETALVAEVRRRPLYALLDVTDPEPPKADSPIRRERNILLTPHLAGATNQACRTMGRLAIDEIIRHVRGEKPLHLVTREMLAVQA